MGVFDPSFYIRPRMEALRGSPQGVRADDGVSTFVKARSRMFAAAFRTLGNAAEAEDVVQDAWFRWQSVRREVVQNAPAFLTTTTRRLAVNRVVGARTRRETPLDAWLLDTVDPEADPGLLTERGQALESALLLVLSKLSPRERAAYLLREAFNYSYAQIARIVCVTEANSRQLVTRARKHLACGPYSEVRASELRRITVAFTDATHTGDLTALEALLSADIERSLARERAGTVRSCLSSTT